MAKVFPEEMDRLDPNNPARSFRVLEDYIRYITERVEFSSANTKRMATDSGITDLAVVELLNQMNGTLSSLESAVNSMRADISGLQERVSALEA